jgi:hypothetical protein
MPAPTASLATLRPDLATFEEFDLEMNRRGYIASQVAPVIEVASQAGNFGKIPIEQLLQTASTTRNPGGGYSRGSWKFTPATYATKEHGWEEPIDDREAKMYSSYFDAEMISTARAYNFVLQNAEIRMAALIFNTGTWTGSTLYTDVGTTEWATYATATPIAHVEAACRKVWTNSGMWPNAIVLNQTKFRDLTQCQQIIDRIVSAGAGDPAKAADITPQMVARVFNLDRVIVAGGAKNTANEGQSISISNVWGDYAMVCRVATTSDPKEPAIARTFHWAEDGSQVGGTVETYRDETIRGNVVRVRHDVDEIVMYTEMGHLIAGI